MLLFLHQSGRPESALIDDCFHLKRLVSHWKIRFGHALVIFRFEKLGFGTIIVILYKLKLLRMFPGCNPEFVG